MKKEIKTKTITVVVDERLAEAIKPMTVKNWHKSDFQNGTSRVYATFELPKATLG